MTTRWRPEFDPEDLYFMTTTATKRTRIFHREPVKRILADGLYYVSLMNKVQLYTFIVMPNHIHAMIQCPPDCPPPKWARAFKTSTSQLIIRLYRVRQNHEALQSLAALVTRPEKQQYKVWEDGYLAKSVLTPEF
jgi:REP element-mobilizing transposase RayT